MAGSKWWLVAMIRVGVAGLAALGLVVGVMGPPAAPISAVTPTPLRLATAVPLLVAPAVEVDVHVEAAVRGSGSVQASAASRNGQALANIVSTGEANGRALVNAPTCAGTCEPLAADGLTDQAPTHQASPSGARALRQISGPAGARLIVLPALVNLRAGPGTAYEVVGAAVSGQVLAIVGRSADARWWQIVQNGADTAWIDDALVQVVEASGVPALDEATSTPLPSATPTPLGYAFAVARTARHQEANSVTLYVWVHDAADHPLEGYLLDVRQAGVWAPGLRLRSTALAQGSTRPACPGCVEDEVYNLKQAWDHVSFPGLSYAGVWTVQLVDGAGAAQSEPVNFTIAPDDPAMELFIDFRKR